MTMGVKSILTELSRRFDHRPENFEYPQTDHLVSPMGPVKKWFVQLLCGLFTGHDFSRDEWSFGEGYWAERKCRWCGKTFLVPKSTLLYEFPDRKSFLDALAKNAPAVATVK